MLKSAVLFLIAAGCSGAYAQAQPAAAQAAGDNQSRAAAWLKATRTAEGVWTISDNGSDNMYLVEGRDKALLIDTGLGVARLSAFVRSLTTKPLTVVNTHGHPDHAGGNFEFKSVYAHPARLCGDPGAEHPGGAQPRRSGGQGERADGPGERR